MLPENIDVLIVGGGPTGLVASTVLTRAGRDVLTLDAQPEGHNTSRAAAIQARTMEILQELGVADTLVDEGVVVPYFTFRNREKLLNELRFADLDTRYPHVTTIQQWRTEEVLTENLHRLGGHITRGYRVTGLDETASGIDVHVDGPDGRETVRARFVVGADGTHSVVRESARIEFVGGDYPQSFVLADAEFDEWPLRFDEVQNFFSPNGIVVSGPLPEGRRRVLFTWPEEVDDVDVALVQNVLDTRGPRGARVSRIAWGSQFHVHHRIAKHFRKGHIFLAGDAAHVHSPAGGQGMNLGIQDAHELGLVLAAALSPTPTVHLDTYEHRRRPIAASTVRLTNLMTTASVAENPVAMKIRDFAMNAIGHLPPARKQMALHMAELVA
ncbi:MULTISPECIES: FAD-dependent monooxygenase [Gordonia]|uniref:FAD-dependent monooxygenase n=1 Tax=Gordonia sp. 852002-10350_SCH5691597 TaxID=1834085 RepID=UPI0007EB4115|nr:FAD-dependent monooxygenase [Gordonia sp. 852002-10350_SCH5691597]OBA70382.1 monooxygenase [Gordonia sp. 852002-10350_SCH5691597]